MIKPEFWSDEKLALVPREARLTFAGLWTCSDDYGVTKGHPAWLKAQIFPYDTDLTLSEFQKWLADLERIGVIDPFMADGSAQYGPGRVARAGGDGDLGPQDPVGFRPVQHHQPGRPERGRQQARAVLTVTF